MTPEEQLLILKWQFCASMLMGLDYFISDAWRSKANKAVSNCLSRVQERADKDLYRSWQYVLKRSRRLKFSLLAIITGAALLYLADELQPVDESFILYVQQFSIIIIAIALFSLFEIVMKTLAHGSIGGLLRTLTTFILGSSKGPVAAIGFIFLLVSFWLRYTYTTNA